MCEPITFLPLAHKNVDSHHSLILSNNWLQKLNRVSQGGRSRDFVPLAN